MEPGRSGVRGGREEGGGRPPLLSLRLQRILPALAAVVAVAALVVILLPASLWKSPANDAVYKGFDSNLLVTNTGGAKVSISHSEIDLAAPRSGQPTVNLATSLLPKLSATVM